MCFVKGTIINVKSVADVVEWMNKMRIDICEFEILLDVFLSVLKLLVFPIVNKILIQLFSINRTF